MIETQRVLDMNGVEIIKGANVIVHQEDGKHPAVVADVFPDSPTKKENGFWCDVDKGDGLEGMMSYIIEVV
jgi:hypothetical protein